MNTFTFENTKEATHLYSNTQFLKIKNGEYEFINSATNFEWNEGGAAITVVGGTELSRPIGERKEDHTIDGVVTYALQPSNSQVIEPWVGDQLTDKPVTVPEFPSEFYQKGGEVANTDLHTPAPVFTQEMSDDGELPPVALLVQIRRDFGDDNEFYNGSLIAEKNGVVWFADDKYGGCLHSLNEITFKPIDNRTEEEKTRDKLTGFITGYTIGGFSDAIDDYVNELLSAFTITLNKE